MKTNLNLKRTPRDGSFSNEYYFLINKQWIEIQGAAYITWLYSADTLPEYGMPCAHISDNENITPMQAYIVLFLTADQDLQSFQQIYLRGEVIYRPACGVTIAWGTWRT